MSNRQKPDRIKKHHRLGALIIAIVMIISLIATYGFSLFY